MQDVEQQDFTRKKQNKKKKLILIFYIEYSYELVSFTKKQLEYICKKNTH